MESVKSWLMTIITMTAQAHSARVLRMAVEFCDSYLSEAAAQPFLKENHNIKKYIFDSLSEKH
ncbi:hypothetical protein C1N59_00210 [Pantoea sp. SGAir0183]